MSGRREELSDKPVALPVGFERPPSLSDTVRRLMGEFSAEAALEGKESFEEADDFDIEDDPVDPMTPWEAEYELSELRRENKRLREESLREEKAKARIKKPARKSAGEKPPRDKPSSSGGSSGSSDPFEHPAGEGSSADE